MHRLVKAAALVAAATAVGCGIVGGQPGDLDDEVADRFERVAARMADPSPGGAVVHVDTPTQRGTVAVGPAGVDGDAQLTGDEAFNIGSINKMMTAVVALQLAAEGTVDLDAPIAEVVPQRIEGFEHGREVTLRQVLGHTAGLAEYRGEAYLADVLQQAAIADGVAMTTCADAAGLDPLDYADHEASFAPGTDWAYSSTGYELAGEVIEAVTDQPLEQVYRQRILDPLGMDQTWMGCREDARAELAGGIHPPGALDVTLPGQDDEPFDVTRLEPYTYAAGGLRSTAEDLAGFARALFDGELFDNEAALETLLQPGPSPQYGLGVELRDDTFGHGGATLGYNANLTFHPAEAVVVVTLTNQTPPSTMQFPADRMTRAILSEAIRLDEP